MTTGCHACGLTADRCCEQGAFLYAYIIGAFSSMMASLSFDRQRYDQKMRTVGHYLKFIGTDAKTTERVNKFYDFRFSRKLMFSA